MTITRPILLGLAVLVGGAGAAFWYVQSSRIETAYLDAAADCDAGLGAARLKATDRLYGRDARPQALAVALSLCDLDDSVQRLNAINGLLANP